MIEGLTFEQIMTAIGGITVLVTGVFYKLGFIHFGKSRGCPDVKKGKCPDPACQERQTQLTDDVSEIKPKVIETAEGVEFLKGWVQGQKNSRE